MRPWYEPGEDTAYGFLTRGCIRNCWFCKVPKHEGRLRVCDTVQNVVGDFKKAVLMDNNLLAYDGIGEALQWLIDHRILSDLNQGLDFRLVTDESMALLAQVRRDAPFTFAFDDVAYEPMLEKAMMTIKRHIPRPWDIRLYCYYHPGMTGGLAGLVHRTEWCRAHECLPYVMRDSACWGMGGGREGIPVGLHRMVQPAGDVQEDHVPGVRCHEARGRTQPPEEGGIADRLRPCEGDGVPHPTDQIGGVDRWTMTSTASLLAGRCQDGQRGAGHGQGGRLRGHRQGPVGRFPCMEGCAGGGDGR